MKFFHPIAVALIGAGIATAASAQVERDDRIDEDGTVTLDGVRVPLPALASPEAKSTCAT